MKLVRWLRFTWDLAKLPEPLSSVEEHYHIRPATREEEETVHHVVMSAFSLDSPWSDTLKYIREWIETQLAECFAGKGVRCLVITHGSRIIAASALALDPEAETHLLTGPCILNEYRSRGLGSILLYHSLAALRDSGLRTAHAITKDNVPTAKFIYPKFNSTNEPVPFAPVMVGS